MKFYCEECGKEMWELVEELEGWNDIRQHTLGEVKQLLVCSDCILDEIREDIAVEQELEKARVDGNLQEYEALKQCVTVYVQKRQAEELPTIRKIARRFSMQQSAILNLIEDTDALNFNIGIAVGGTGTYVHPHIGDYTVECDTKL